MPIPNQSHAGTSARLKSYSRAIAPASMLIAKLPARLLTEWIGQLPTDLGGDLLIVYAVIVRQPALRHAERAEQDVPEREGAREIGIAALFQRGVMPAVEDRRGKHVFKRAERPVQVGVNERGVEGRERPDPQHDVGRDARYQQDDVDQDRSDKQVDGVKPRRRDPLQIFRGMMDGV